MATASRFNQWGALLGWLLISSSAGIVGRLASSRTESIYQTLTQPNWAPPSWLFGPVWSVLYVLMGIAAWVVWRERGFRGARSALVLFIAQLAANAVWTWIFFAWLQGALAFVEILVLLALIVATLIAFWRVRPLAGILLVPYLLWVCYASALTFATWQLNPGVL